MNIISTEKIVKIRAHRKLAQFMKVKDNLDFDEFLVEVGVSKIGNFSNPTEFEQVINYVLQVHSYQQLFIWAPAIFRKPLHTYICLDAYTETLRVAITEV